ncbi:MAG TPA: hypothetical protein VN577_23165 [Terriglobales bacterium]|nr:hypothetical protein [Terriglobales bacterium]
MSTGQVLTSWKEIASYMGKGVRTVQRWEQELGLPVRRPGEDRHIVLAFPAELEQWARRNRDSESKTASSGNGNGHHPHAASHANVRRMRELVQVTLQQTRMTQQKVAEVLKKCEKASQLRRVPPTEIAKEY